MTDDHPETDDDGIDRRTVLKASSASMAGVALSTTASGDPGDRRHHRVQERISRPPDVRVLDNSSSSDPVTVSYRERTDDHDTEGRTIDSVTLETIGTNAP